MDWNIFSIQTEREGPGYLSRLAITQVMTEMTEITKTDLSHIRPLAPTVVTTAAQCLTMSPQLSIFTSFKVTNPHPPNNINLIKYFKIKSSLLWLQVIQSLIINVQFFISSSITFSNWLYFKIEFEIKFLIFVFIK